MSWVDAVLSCLKWISAGFVAVVLFLLILGLSSKLWRWLTGTTSPEDGSTSSEMSGRTDWRGP